VPAPESRSPFLAGTLLPAAAVLLAVVLLGAKAWSALPRIAELGTSSLRAEDATPLPPPLTRIDDSIFRPLRVPDPRAMYSLNAGWEARGGEWAMATPREQLDRFRELATAAGGDARAGLDANPSHLVGHYVLLNLARAFAPAREIRTLLNEALSRHPDSYVLRDEYMTSLEPRWGGSYRRMRAFGEESARRTARNPRLATLRGAEHVYRAWEHRRKDDYAAALAEYEQALRHGPEREALLQRGLTYYRAKDYARAHADLEMALQQRPQGPQALEYHGRSLYYMARALPNAIRGSALARAEADFALLGAVDPDNEEVAEWLGHVAEMRRWCASQPQPCR
jgi:tetratricopeptide (TPR) repeat protein